MEDWTARLKTLSDDELFQLEELVGNELRSRNDESHQWKRCPICSGTGKYSGGYCRCAVGRDIRILEIGKAASYGPPYQRWDDV
jgi:hypothetical protein